MTVTLEEIKNSDSLFLTAKDISEVLKTDPNKIRMEAQTRPQALGFPVTVTGTRVKIWRKPFLKFIGEE